MIDPAALRGWMQPRHLDVDALEAYREAFTSHPARMVVLEDVLVEPVAERLWRFLDAEAQFEKEHGIYSVHEGGVSEETWLQADQADRFFRYGKLVGTPPEFQLSPNALTYLRFRKAFQDPNFLRFFERLSGLSLGWSDDFGSHAMGRGDFLKAHDDDNRNRRLALVIYLSPGWDPAFGGALHVVDATGNTTVVDARYNRMVVFDVAANSTHSVSPIEAAAEDKKRLTIGGWYHRPD
jgi:hypothetical protein